MALDASYFVSKALQNALPWTSLEMILKDLAPTLDEANDVIRVLLKELEILQFTLQQKEKALEKYINQSEVLTDKTEDENCDEQNMALESEPNFENTNEKETEMIKDDIGLFEEKVNEEINLEVNEGTKRTDENTTDISESHDSNSEKNSD